MGSKGRLIVWRTACGGVVPRRVLRWMGGGCGMQVGDGVRGSEGVEVGEGLVHGAVERDWVSGVVGKRRRDKRGC